MQKDGLYDGQVDSGESIRNKGGGVLMRITSFHWEFDALTDFCCEEFKMHAMFNVTGSPDIVVSKHGDGVSFKDVAIRNCPFCGKKITLEKEVS
jgi:hypothetical protein